MVWPGSRQTLGGNPQCAPPRTKTRHAGIAREQSWNATSRKAGAQLTVSSPASPTATPSTEGRSCPSIPLSVVTRASNTVRELVESPPSRTLLQVQHVRGPHEDLPVMHDPEWTLHMGHDRNWSVNMPHRIAHIVEPLLRIPRPAPDQLRSAGHSPFGAGKAEMTA